jgi:hypothetical protein
LDNTGTIIVGVDDHGWSLDKYVIPRLGSALIHCEEVFEVNGLNLTQLELNLKLQRAAEPKKKRGRAPALSIPETEEVRNAWRENDLLWQRYRAYAHKFDKPHQLTVSDLAIRFRVSEGVIADVINREGAYKA